MEDITKVESYLAALDSSIDTLEDTVNPILGKDMVLITEDLDPISRIKAYNNYLYVTISTLFAYLKSTGVKTESHPIMEELARIKKSMNKVKELEQKLQLKDTSAQDSETAKRLIQQALGNNVNGGGAAAPDSIKKPAISSASFKGLEFQGKHTKFHEKTTPTKVTKPKKSQDDKAKGKKKARK